MLRKTLYLLLLCTVLPLPALGGERASALVNAGIRQWSEGKTAEAESSFKRAIALDADYARAYARLGSLYLTENRSAEAIPVYQQAIMHDPRDPRLFVAVAIAYLHQGHYGMAHDMTEQALRLNPKLAGALKMKRYVEAKQAAITAAQDAGAAGPAPAGHP